jgi:hypothetical protein
VSGFSMKVNNHPVVFSELNRHGRKGKEFAAPQSATNQKSKNGVVAFTSKTITMGFQQQRAALIGMPRRTPIRRTPLTRRMPAASSGLSKPESVASYATRLTAARRRLIVVGARCRCSKWIRYRRTTVRLKASLGSEQYQSTNSLIA